ncbi:hypothetical protein HELRODRAFT_62339 [Helobdella robusta]|uniref:Wiskott-Aldrich syndrome protein family member n=1 Tax=Helobdella robusta TaxID=6412 RepID=T1FWZ8_HELRO|nr:hypothetical protein HELRODRAFT_62339 [Helobdella robusta]ESO12588.1 hypothetical protein HELRODRAFT_62339 [Helobdella robusta]
MPLVKRSIEPSAISHGAIGSDVRNELECVSNNTLSKIIKQLGSLSKQSEDLFAELYVETCTLANRTTNLGRRIDGLKQKICQLNPIVEEVSLQEINQRKPFKSVMCRDQQIMLRSTRPHSIAEVYKMCEMPPALNKLDVFREDGMDSLKFYTNPEYFAELWFAEMKAAQHQQKKIKQKHSQLVGRFLSPIHL